MTPERLGPLWVGLAGGVVLTLLILVWGDVRVGAYLMGAVLLLAAAARGSAPERTAFALKVRSRWLDVLMYVTLAAAIIAMAWTVDLP